VAKKEEANVLKFFLKTKYQFHLLLKKYNEVLMEDAVCKKLRNQLQQRAAYHSQQAFFLGSKI
jgi:hypothetical protein